MGVFSDWPVQVFCQFLSGLSGLCLHPADGKNNVSLQRALSWQFLKSLALDGETEQRTTTGPQISANERVNMEPSSQLLLLLTPKIGRNSISWQAGEAGWARSRIYIIPRTSPRYQ